MLIDTGGYKTMVFSEYDGIKISAIAASVPENVMDIAKKLDDPEEDPKFIKQFMKNTGIRQKRKSSYEQTKETIHIEFYFCKSVPKLQNKSHIKPLFTKLFKFP